jgi:hypothetical protein
VTLLATKSEVEAIAALLVEGDETPEALAKKVIKTLSELREARKQYHLVVELSPGLYETEGPYPTRDAATKSAKKNLWVAHLGRKWAVASGYGQAHTLAQQKAAEEKPPNVRGDMAEVALDAQAARNGWKGKAADRQRYLTSTQGEQL